MAEDELYPEKVVQLTPDASGEQIPMQVYLEVDQDGRVYALLTPQDPLVLVLRATHLQNETDEEGGTLEELEVEEFGPLAKEINHVLKEWGVKIEVRSEEYVLVGEANEGLYEDCEILPVVVEGEEEEYLVLAELDSGDTLYMVCEPASPDLFPVELQEDVPRLLTDEELDGGLEEMFRAALQQIEDPE